MWFVLLWLCLLVVTMSAGYFLFEYVGFEYSTVSYFFGVFQTLAMCVCIFFLFQS